MDNASANGNMAGALEVIMAQKYNQKFDRANAQIRCTPHALNRVAQKFLSALNEGYDPDIFDCFSIDPSSSLSYDQSTDSFLSDFEGETDLLTEAGSEDRALLKDSAWSSDEVESPVKKVSQYVCLVSLLSVNDRQSSQLRTIVTKICVSPERRAVFRHIQKMESERPGESLKGKSLMVIKDVITRWNFTHAMIKRGLLLRRVSLQVAVYSYKTALDDLFRLSMAGWRITSSIRFKSRTLNGGNLRILPTY